MELIREASLKPFITFGVEAGCDHLYRVEDFEELKLAVQFLERPLILGGGSNVLPIGDIHRNILRIELSGIEVLEDGDQPLIWIAAGENWHDFVLWSLRQELGGIENLSLIPGTMGAAPMQNIGAYGVELESVFHSLQAIEVGTGKLRTFSKEDCKFGYRDSIFKHEVKDQYVITGVLLRLNKQHHVNTSYGALQSIMSEWGIEHPTIHDVSRAVIQIRRSKLPDPAEIGNAGSFFKNPIVPLEFFEALKQSFPEIPSYSSGRDLVKIPAGWLIEQAGWKGKSIGNAGCYEKQALVLINRGSATGAEIWHLAEEIIASVQEKYQVRLQPEVNIWRYD